MPKTLKNLKIAICFLALFTIISCDGKRVFDEYKSVAKTNWNVNKPIAFQFEIQDTIAKRNLFINLRNNNNYEFSNLFLITKITFPNNQQVIDTLEYEMTDKTGKFLGSGFSEIKENKLFYKEHITFPISGIYTLEIAQAMRKNGEIEGEQILKGITDVGFRIEK